MYIGSNWSEKCSNLGFRGSKTKSVPLSNYKSRRNLMILRFRGSLIIFFVKLFVDSEKEILGAKL